MLGWMSYIFERDILSLCPNGRHKESTGKHCCFSTQKELDNLFRCRLLVCMCNMRGGVLLFCIHCYSREMAFTVIILSMLSSCFMEFVYKKKVSKICCWLNYMNYIYIFCTLSTVDEIIPFKLSLESQIKKKTKF